MHAIALNSHQFGQHLALLADMYRLRRRVFKDRMHWNVSISGELEIDVFDALNPTYLIALEGRLVVGSVRLLPTTGPTMLAETFTQLLAGQASPNSKRILESSRFCVDTSLVAELGRGGLNRATVVLFAAMIEHLRATGGDSIVTVTDTRMERILRRAAWPLERIGMPQPIGRTMALAGFLHASDDALDAMYRHAGVSGPVLTSPASLIVAA